MIEKSRCVWGNFTLNNKLKSKNRISIIIGCEGAKELGGTILYVVSERFVIFESAIIELVDGAFCAYLGVQKFNE